MSSLRMEIKYFKSAVRLWTQILSTKEVYGLSKLEVKNILPLGLVQAKRVFEFIQNPPFTRVANLIGKSGNF